MLAFQKQKVNKESLTAIVADIYRAHNLTVPADFKCKSAPSAVAGIVEIDGMIWYYHEQAAGAYHAIERRADGPRRTYHALFCIDPETGEARSYSGPLPSRYQAEAVLHHLAPDAVRLDGLPAFMR